MRRSCVRASAPALLAAAVTVAGSLGAQTPPDSAAPTAGPRPHAGAVGPTRPVRVRVATDGRRIDGRAAGQTGDTLLVRQADGGVARIPAARIDTLWLRDGRATGRGLRVGAGLGAVALGGFAFFLTQVLCDTPVCSTPTREVLGITLLGAGLGAAGGAAAGGLIGAVIPAWRRVRP